MIEAELDKAREHRTWLVWRNTVQAYANTRAKLVTLDSQPNTPTGNAYVLYGGSLWWAYSGDLRLATPQDLLEL